MISKKIYQIGLVNKIITKQNRFQQISKNQILERHKKLTQVIASFFIVYVLCFTVGQVEVYKKCQFIQFKFRLIILHHFLQGCVF